MSAARDPRFAPRSIIDVAEEVVEQVRKDERMSDALDAYPADRENIHVRWFSNLRAYEVTLRFDAATLDGEVARGGPDTSSVPDDG